MITSTIVTIAVFLKLRTMLLHLVRGTVSRLLGQKHTRPTIQQEVSDEDDALQGYQGVLLQETKIVCRETLDLCSDAYLFTAG